MEIFPIKRVKTLKKIEWRYSVGARMGDKSNEDRFSWGWVLIFNRVV